MKRSTERILTTHAGSLARPQLLDTMKERENGRPYDAQLLDRQVHDAVADRVRQRVENGIDIVTDGEMSKVSFLGYVKDRLGGFEPDMNTTRMAPSWQKEIDDFPEYERKYSSTVTPLRRIICRGPISYVGQDLLQTDIDNLRGRRTARRGRRVHALDRAERVRRQRVLRQPRGVPGGRRRGHARGVPGHRCRRVRPPDRPVPDRHAERSVHGAGRARADGLDARRGAQPRLRDIPTDQIRHHVLRPEPRPRMNDIPLIEVVPFMLAINAGAHSFEVANPRHYHEWRIWGT